MTSLKVAIDLGSDRIKVAFAYKAGEKAVYGKLAAKDVTGSTVTPAIAYYDEDGGRWLFGEQVYNGTDRPFITVVKIKTLISLLMRRENRDITLSNRNYYRNGYDFPKFYFPSKKKISANLKEAVELDMTFRGDVTPEKVCESFFVYLAQEVVNPAIERLKAERNLDFDDVEYALVYPAKAGRQVVDELKRLIRYAFGKLPRTVISATKALGLFAYHRGKLFGEEQLVIVDMGEEDISVAKLSIATDKCTVLVDGVDGHNQPMDIGGNDIDDAVRDLLEDNIRGRETLGVSDDTKDFVAERGTHSGQFLLMTEIKKAKNALSLPDAVYDRIFPDGVPLSFLRDVIIQRKITRKEFCDCIGITANDKIAGQIAEYIVSELKRSVNSKVSKLALSGGVAETYGLVRFIKKVLRENSIGVEVITFDDYCNDDDGFNILSYEDSVFAPAAGGAIVALMGYEIKTAAALSYGTWQYRKKGDKYYKILDIFLKKGEILPPEGGIYCVSSCLKYLDKWEGKVVNEEIFSTTAVDTCEIGEPDSQLRKAMEERIDLKVVAGGKSRGAIYICHKEKDGTFTPVQIKGTLYFNEGVRIDGDGRAVPFIENNLERNGANSIIKIRPCDNVFEIKYVCYKELVLRFSGVDEFDVEGGD